MKNPRDGEGCSRRSSRSTISAIVENPSSRARDAMVLAMARSVPDGALCVQGLSTPLATAALLVAKATHAPELTILYTDGGVVGDRPHPLTVTDATLHAVRASQRSFTFAELILELVPRYQPFEFMRPAQLDARGRSNNVRIDSARGPVPLPGAAGIPDATSVNGNLAYYLPRHDPRTLVAEVDAVSGAGRPRSRGARPKVPRRVFTELCELAYDEDGVCRVLSLRADVELAEVRARTGFVLEAHHAIHRQPIPTIQEREALDTVDPRRLRDLEFLPRRERLARLAEEVL